MDTSIDKGIPAVWNPGNGTQYPLAHEVDIDYTQPRGLVGELASHIYCAARKQVKEVGNGLFCSSLNLCDCLWTPFLRHVTVATLDVVANVTLSGELWRTVNL